MSVEVVFVMLSAELSVSVIITSMAESIQTWPPRHVRRFVEIICIIQGQLVLPIRSSYIYIYLYRQWERRLVS